MITVTLPIEQYEQLKAQARTQPPIYSSCGVTSDLLQNLASVSLLPGSPTVADCIKQIIEELPRLRSQELDTVTIGKLRSEIDKMLRLAQVIRINQVAMASELKTWPKSILQSCDEAWAELNRISREASL